MSLHHGVSLEATDRRPTVLLVDDDEVNLLMTAAALRDRGFDITSTTGGEEALTRLASWTPDVVVLDAIMPGLDGFETCIALRNMPGFDNVPVLMLTGLDDEASINRAYQVGATDFFVKATQWSLLAGRLRYLLRAGDQPAAEALIDRFQAEAGRVDQAVGQTLRHLEAAAS